ncbi:Fe-S cluster assembly sulfur transfer protein SufU [Arachnia rubra]|jgi:SUF system feS assembly protein, nifU family|uniref:SUF system NifU family Fe-S cluster assembly protein n=1 Tax=Arachnia rubra TaxID=1547448 RepID=A0ABX7Y280_9ACTN|nr:SUF system NifU family Fe-S cluster assembly protein [Arachnia rubra]MBB1577089.1 SUF system NifU family Fe-S cluster assembly protein [Propionibacterium sp.]MDO4644838.1 SUF system NifU family Fe-S cluster assembly protein [Propionibacteriaceae bacterium]QUC07244.1 SUF system NifU family Fe-S cluster assembly protein [Arachnia rubra]BCR81511.1 iron-sulfur cluster assembly scaffold protein NifU [Arachnia rubra]
MNLDELYQTIILDHYREKHHSGLRDPYEAEVHHVNPSCGDELTLRVHLDGGTIADMSYAGEGCSISQASTSVLGDLVIGQDINYFSGLYDEFLEMMHSKGEITPDEDRFEDAIAFAGVSKFPARVKCALLAWSALRDAVNQASAKEN